MESDGEVGNRCVVEFEFEVEVEMEIEDEVLDKGSQLLMSIFCVLFVDQMETLWGSNRFPREDLFEFGSAE